MQVKDNSFPKLKPIDTPLRQWCLELLPSSLSTDNVIAFVASPPFVLTSINRSVLNAYAEANDVGRTLAKDCDDK